MRELVDDLLDLWRVARGVISLEMERVDMLAVVASAMEQSKNSRNLIDARSQQLVLDMPRDPAWVHGDRSRLIQVVANLLNNVAKYTHDGGRIVVRMTVHAGRVRLAVEDNGIGID